jgi:hypothetical protein
MSSVKYKFAEAHQSMIDAVAKAESIIGIAIA